MLSCKDTTVMVSQSLDRTLTLRERLGVKLHLMICVACRRMLKQMQLLSSVAQHYSALEDEGPSRAQQHLSKEAGDRILEKLRNAGQNHPDSD